MEVLGVIIGVIALLVFLFIPDKKTNNKWRRGELRVSRDSNGEFYVYEVASGREIFRSPEKYQCIQFVQEWTY